MIITSYFGGMGCRRNCNDVSHSLMYTYIFLRIESLLLDPFLFFFDFDECKEYLVSL